MKKPVTAEPSMAAELRALTRAYVSKRGPKCYVCSLAPEVLGVVKDLRQEGAAFSAIAHALAGMQERIGPRVITAATLAHHERAGH